MATLNGTTVSFPMSGNLFHVNQTHSSSTPNIDFSLNGSNIVSNNRPAIFDLDNSRTAPILNISSSPKLNNYGSNQVSSGAGNSRSWNSQDVLNYGELALSILNAGYNIFNSERNFRNEQEAYNYNRAMNERVMYNQENAILNQARQYGEIGLNPLYMSGNGMSYSYPGQVSAPQHSNLSNLQTLQFIDNLRSSAAQRSLIQTQAELNRGKAAAQILTNEKTKAQIQQYLKNLGKTDAEIRKIESQIDRLDILTKTGQWDYDVTTGKIVGRRSNDRENEWVTLVKDIIGMIFPADRQNTGSLSVPSSIDDKYRFWKDYSDVNPNYVYKTLGYM